RRRLVPRWQSIRSQETRRRSSRYPVRSPRSFSWNQLQAFSPRRAQVCFTQPTGKERESGDHVNEPRGDPHDQAAELLILERRESPRCSETRVRRIPRCSGDSDECAECAAVNGSREEIEHGRAVTHRALWSMNEGPPEQKRGEQERKMLKRVNCFAVQRCVKERGNVPNP